MNSTIHRANIVRRCLPLLLLAAPLGASALPVISFANIPLFLAPTVKPNLMVILDNSESMDATMSGKVISGDDVNTRGNIARDVLRTLLTTYRSSFNWGLSTFDTVGANNAYWTYVYLLGGPTTMVYTNDCNAAGRSPSNANLRCVANPEPANGFAFITYEKSSDDSNINDVFYDTPFGGGNFGNQQYGVGIGTAGVCYNLYTNHGSAAGAGWADANFSGLRGGLCFTPTDAGYVPHVEDVTRELYLLRGWGYNNNISGAGRIVEPVMPDSATHFDTLLASLANETVNATAEIKNSAVFTPLTGSLQTVKNYFNNSTGKSPISATCQRNYVILATDGNPTGKTNGDQYDPSQWVNTLNTTTGLWTYGQAQQDVFAELTALRSTTVGAKTYDVQTYIVGMGSTLDNPSSTEALDKMAKLGGGYSTAFLGTTAADLTAAFKSIVVDIKAKASAASSVALNGGSWNAGSSLYQARFDPTDWSGNLAAYSVAASGVVAAAPTWQSGVQVKGQNWDTGRQIMTYKPSAAAGSRGIAFRWPASASAPAGTELDPSQITALNTNATAANDGYGEARLKYLRGDVSREPRNCVGTCPAPQFRNRNTTTLGDIVNSSPYYVGVPNFGYYDDMESVAYSSFVAAKRTRTPIIYAGANDGMLHGFDATTGNEVMAYVPSMLYSGLSQLADLNYSHRYFVDGSPTVGDVFYAGAWHSLLVSGLRAGGKGLFALDVTSPGTLTEANASSIVRWEFQDADMGYIFGQPLLVKTNNGKWSVIVSGGYNHGNANGHAFLFIIDAETGALVRKIDTGAGTATSPNGLSPAAAIDINGDNVADVVYAGDLNGNLWKFDLTSAASGSWGMGNGGLPLFTTPSNPAAVPTPQYQSITARPDVTKFPTGGYLISFGTGRFIADSDRTDTTAQAEYGIRDTLVNGTVTLAQLQQQSILDVANGADGNPYRFSSHAVGKPTDAKVTGDEVITRAYYYSNYKGWYVNLPTAGERVVADARFRGGRVVLTSLIPDLSNPCAFGGDGWVMEFDAITGNRLDTTTFDTNGDNTLSSDGDNIAFGAYTDAGKTIKHNTSGRKIGAIPAAPGFMGNKEGTLSLEDKYINTSDGSVIRVRETAGKGGEGRVMWREVR